MSSYHEKVEKKHVNQTICSCGKSIIELSKWIIQYNFQEFATHMEVINLHMMK